jgi:hypothetical protein
MGRLVQQSAPAQPARLHPGPGPRDRLLRSTPGVPSRRCLNYEAGIKPGTVQVLVQQRQAVVQAGSSAGRIVDGVARGVHQRAAVFSSPRSVAMEQICVARTPPNARCRLAATRSRIKALPPQSVSPLPKKLPEVVSVAPSSVSTRPRAVRIAARPKSKRAGSSRLTTEVPASGVLAGQSR